MKSQSKAREFWIDSAPSFNGLNMYPYKKAFENIQDAEDQIVGNTYHVIEKSAYNKAVEALIVAQKEIQRLNVEAPLELTITTGRINLELIETLRELGVE